MSTNNGTTGTNGSTTGSGGGGVTVLASGSVGPYDYDVIEVDESLDDRASVAVAWLEENNYDVLALGPETMRDYLDAGMNLLAFRLSKGNDSGDIRPIQMTYETETPMIPIKLTAVAANDDMGVLVWVLSDSRAVPVNYRSLVLNEALINWFNPAPTYNDVVVRAANESGGQGFVTEFAGVAAPVVDANGVFQDASVEELEALRDTWAGADNAQAGFAGQIWLRYGDWSGFAEALREMAASLEEGSEAAATLTRCADGPPSAIGSPSGRLECRTGSGDVFEIDVSGLSLDVMFEAVSTNVVEPVIATRALFEARPYMTRLYSTLSAAEMTLDPVFRFNADLPDVSNVHTADRIIECAPSLFLWEAPWRVELPQGGVVRGRDTLWPLSPSSGMPANLLIRQDTTEGAGEVVEDNTATIQQALDTNNAQFPSPSTNNGTSGRGANNGTGGINGGDAPSDASEDSEGCACAVSPSPPAPLRAPWLLAGLAVLRWSVRRRRRML